MQTLTDRANNIDIKTTCIKCGNHNIQDPQWSTGPHDWKCLDCNTLQLTYMKEHGLRYYAFLLSGSWTSEYIKAHTLKQAYNRAVKMYKDKHEVYKSYLVGPLDGFSLKGWLSFA